MKNHEFFLNRCMELAEQAKANGEAAVGSLLVLDNTIIGEASENTKASKDVTQHAEILAIKDAINLGNLSKLENSILYSTHEPCFMCSYVIRHHNIPTIVYQKKVDSVGGIHSEFKVLGSTSNPAWGKPPAIFKVP